MTTSEPSWQPDDDDPLHDLSSADAAPGSTRQARRRRRRRRRAAVIALGLVLALCCAAAAGIYVVTDRLTGNVQRVPGVFASIDPATRPAAPAGEAAGGTTFLVAGSDSLSPEATTGTDGTGPEFVPGGQRSDAIMLVRLSADRRSATVASIPRDSWVEVPGHGMAKINAAYSIAGAGLMVQTVESVTGVRVDHFATIDFAGFRAVVDAVGGIDVTVAAATRHGDVVFREGVNHLDGTMALAYVRQRKGLPRGDLDRVQRQQNLLRALLTKLADGGTTTDPVRLFRFADAVTRSASVDDSLDDAELRSLALSLRNLRPSGITFATAPVSGPGREGDQSVIHLDAATGAQFWAAFAGDRLDDHLRLHPGDTLGSAPR